MSIINYETNEHIAILTLNYGENKFDSKFIIDFINKLDDIKNNTNATTLIVTSSHHKIFSNGINLDWLLNIIKEKKINEVKKFFYLLNKLLIKILTYPLINIACINGHAFAGGAILSCSFDFRFMRSDRGFLCFPEIDLGIPFLPGMNAIIKKTIPVHLTEYMELSGIRINAIKCKKNKIITQYYHINSLLKETISFAKTIKKSRKITKEIKKRLNSKIIKTIQIEDKKYIELENFSIKNNLKNI